MMPGISARPPASTISVASLSTAPIAAMRPSFTATSARTGSCPSPSTTIAPRITRSYMPISPYAGSVIASVAKQSRAAVVAAPRSVESEGLAGQILGAFDRDQDRVALLVRVALFFRLDQPLPDL